MNRNILGLATALCMMFICLLTSAPAIAGSWVNVSGTYSSGAQECGGNPYGTCIVYTWGWPADDDTLAPAVCRIAPGCEVGISPAGREGGAPPINIIGAVARTMKELRAQWVAKHGSSGSGYMNSVFCCSGYKLVFTYNKGSSVYGSWQRLPNATPSSMPEPSNICEITGDLDIQYGNVSQDNLAGLSRSGTTQIYCSTGTTVQVFLAGQDFIPLLPDVGLRANIRFNGEPLTSAGTSIPVSEGQTTHVVETTLVTEGDTPGGNYQGSGTIIISYP